MAANTLLIIIVSNSFVALNLDYKCKTKSDQQEQNQVLGQEKRSVQWRYKRNETASVDVI